MYQKHMCLDKESLDKIFEHSVILYVEATVCTLKRLHKWLDCKLAVQRKKSSSRLMWNRGPFYAEIRPVK